MLFRRNITVRPLTGRERRRLYIYQPDSRLFGADTRYPVLYMFDGHNVFLDEDATYDKSWGMLEYLQEHPHIAVFEDGTLKYEIYRQYVGDAASFNLQLTRSARSYTSSLDNMGAVITVFEY